MDDLARGWEFQKANRLAEAEASYRQLLTANPQHARGWGLLGVLYFTQRRLDQAISCYLRSLTVEPGSPEVLTNLGVAHAFKRDFRTAEQRFREAIARQPDHFDALRNLGNVLCDQNKFVDAIAVFQDARQYQPENVDVLCGLGRALQHANRAVEAIEPLLSAVKLAPRSAVSHQLLGTSLAKASRFQDAESAFKCALALAPNDAGNHNGMGIVLAAQKRLVEAEAAFRAATELNPKLVGAHQNLGNVLRDRHQHEQALQSYATALALKSNNAEAHNNIGLLLGRIGKHREAVEAYDRTLQLDPAHHDARKNRAIEKLLLGDYHEGFAEYEYRWNCAGFKRPDFPQPRWNGEQIYGKTILLIAEQGLGDVIQFIRFATKIKALGTRVLFRCPKPLFKLFGSAAGIDQLIPDGDPLPAFDLYVPLISLAAIFRIGVKDVPGIQAIPYLYADPKLVAIWSERLGPKAPGEFRVGIAWQGSPAYGGDPFRSVPLAEFVPLAAIPGVKLISLQKDYGIEQIAPLAEKLGLIDFGDQLDRESGPFMDTAALMKVLDLVITINSSPVHLAGALGVPTWLALSTDSDWRWVDGREDSPWYPTVRVFRQTVLFGWSEVFERIAIALRERVENQAGGG